MVPNLRLVLQKMTCVTVSVIQITQGVELPILFDHHEEPLDSFEGQLITFDENPDQICHQVRCHLQHIKRKYGSVG
jgi:hypothetical protein